ncbi:uncharacterized protein BXZ73DRAFT_22324, partial [Epithele typhae]|uniref:uncharacterized protein n=1 Tax=Epithele typhae TaxID=378194 RepID=UPI0020075BCD
IFLAGSIEMGKAHNWQLDLTKALAPLEVTILNPRRDNWNNTWEQRARHPEFHAQVKWEMDELDAADVIAMYFDPATIAPISLLELGMYAATGKMVVCCPEKYHRLGNVEMVCEKYKVPL